MARQVKDCSSDQRALLTVMGIHMKNPRPCVSEPKQNSMGSVAFDHEHESCKSTKIDTGNKVCRADSDNDECANDYNVGHRHRMWLLLVFSISCFTFLLYTCSFIYLVHWDRPNTSEVQELKKQIEQLQARCNFVKAWPTSDTVNAGDGMVDVTATGGQTGLPWQQNANTPAKRIAPNGFYQSHYGGERQDAGSHYYYEDESDDEEDTGDDLFYTALSGKSRQKRAAKRSTKQKENGPIGEISEKGNGKKSKACRRVEKCIQTKKSGKTVNKRCGKILKCIPPPEPAAFTPKAVHFTSSYGNVRRDEFPRDSATEDVVLTAEEAPLRFYEEADWMKTIYKDKSQQPIVPLRDGVYKVTQSGLYLIYSSIMFHDVKPRQSLAVVVNGVRLFKCMESVDFITEDAQQNPVAKYKTCTLTGVTRLNVNDRLEVQNLYAQTEIDLSTDATYVGAVLLSPGEVKTGN